MPQETEITYVLGKGIDQQTNPIVADGLFELENCEFIQDGSIRVRDVTSESDQSAALVDVMSVVSLRNSSERYFCRNSKYLGHQQTNSLGNVVYGSTPEIYIDKAITIRPTGNIVRHSDYAASIVDFSGWFICNSSVSATTAPTSLAIGTRTRQNIVATADISAQFSTSSPLVGDFFYSPRLIYQSGFSAVQILAEGNDTGATPNVIMGSTTPAVTTSVSVANAVTYVTDLEPGIYVAWDCCSIPGTDDFIIAYKKYSAAGPWTAVVTRFSQSTGAVVVSTVNCTHNINQDSFISCCAVGTNAYVTYIDNNVDLIVEQIDTSSSSLAIGSHAVVSTSYVATDYFINGWITTGNKGSSTTCLFIALTCGNSTIPGYVSTHFYQIDDITGTLGAVISSPRKEWEWLQTRPFKINGINYFATCQFGSGSRTSYHVWAISHATSTASSSNRVDICGSLSHDRAETIPLTAGIEDRGALNGATQYGLCLPYYRDVSARDLAIYDVITRKGILKYQDNSSCMAAGGILRTIKSNKVYDSGFVCHPFVYSASIAAGGSINIGDVYYRVMYEYIDDSGMIHRSRVSTPPLSAHATSAAANNTCVVTIACPTSFASVKGDRVVCKLYRRHSAGTTSSYYYTGLSYAVSAFPTYTIVFTDTLSNAAVESNGILYTELEYESYPAPPSAGIASGGIRLFILSSENRKEVYYSKPIGQFFAPEFGDGMTISFQENIFAIAYYGNKLYAFSSSKVYSVFGDGPDILGSGGYFSLPQTEASLGGCINPFSVESIPIGIFYQTGASGFPNWYDADSKYNDFLLVGGEPRSVGKRLSIITTRTELVNSIANVESKESLYLACGIVGGSQYGDRPLVYNYRLDAWSKFFFQSSKNISHAFQFDDDWSFCSSSGVILYPTKSAGSYNTSVSFRTPWLNPSGNLFTTFKAWWLSLVGFKSGSASTLFTFTIYYDGGLSSNYYTKTITSIDPMLFRMMLAKRCRSISIKVSFSATNEQFDFYAVKLTCGVYGAAHKPIGGATTTI